MYWCVTIIFLHGMNLHENRMVWAIISIMRCLPTVASSSVAFASMVHMIFGTSYFLYVYLWLSSTGSDILCKIAVFNFISGIEVIADTSDSRA